MCHLTTTQSVYLHTYCIPLNSGILVHVLDVYTHSSSYIHAVDVFISLHHCTFLNFADFTIGQIAGMIVGAFLFCLLITILPIVLCCICCCCCSRCGASEWLRQACTQRETERCTLFVASKRNYKKNLQIHARTWNFHRCILWQSSPVTQQTIANTRWLSSTAHMFTCI